VFAVVVPDGFPFELINAAPAGLLMAESTPKTTVTAAVATRTLGR
jgi:hypothetical protein